MQLLLLHLKIRVSRPFSDEQEPLELIVPIASKLPDLSNATLDELTTGLRQNDFTSVDLVKVRFFGLYPYTETHDH